MEVKSSFFTPFTHAFKIEKLDHVACNLCASESYTLITTELIFEIRECSECGLVYVSPQPAAEELPKFYSGMYEDHSERAAEDRSLGAVEKHLRAIVQQRRPQGGRYLDVGCGFGRLLETLNGLPFSFTGIEMDPNAVEYARRAAPNADIRQAGIDDAVFDPESQDFISLVAVLEHVKDPRDALARITGWLAPGGVLLVQVPYIQAYMRLKRWLPWLPVNFEAPRHLFDFSPKTLPRYFDELGYEDVRVEIARPFSSPSKIGALLIWKIKLIGLFFYYVSGKRYIYPFAGAIVVHGRKPVR